MAYGHADGPHDSLFEGAGAEEEAHDEGVGEADAGSIIESISSTSKACYRARIMLTRIVLLRCSLVDRSGGTKGRSDGCPTSGLCLFVIYV